MCRYIHIYTRTFTIHIYVYLHIYILVLIYCNDIADCLETGQSGADTGFLPGALKSCI